MVSEARVVGEDLQGRHRKRKNKEERMKSVLEGWSCCILHTACFHRFYDHWVLLTSCSWWDRLSRFRSLRRTQCLIVLCILYHQTLNRSGRGEAGSMPRVDKLEPLLVTTLAIVYLALLAVSVTSLVSACMPYMKSARECYKL